MPAVLRITDIGFGVCPLHRTPEPYTAILSTGPGPHFANGLQVAALSSIAICSCGHPAVMITAGSVAYSFGVAVSRASDLGQNPGICIFPTGSPTVFAS